MPLFLKNPVDKEIKKEIGKVDEFRVEKIDEVVTAVLDTCRQTVFQAFVSAEATDEDPAIIILKKIIRDRVYAVLIILIKETVSVSRDVDTRKEIVAKMRESGVLGPKENSHFVTEVLFMEVLDSIMNGRGEYIGKGYSNLSVIYNNAVQAYNFSGFLNNINEDTILRAIIRDLILKGMNYEAILQTLDKKKIEITAHQYHQAITRICGVRKLKELPQAFRIPEERVEEMRKASHEKTNKWNSKRRKSSITRKTEPEPEQQGASLIHPKPSQRLELKLLQRTDKNPDDGDPNDSN
ncbi:MAG: hypothetical protein UR28_C0003G0086 [Candidatus Peregrinibacteria bacterium GW2011_GWF2_33_10]|nr:MAG: hypothetical protein UR28_C0003G0086 [Candidatus Peregrinibacteria bacterium GW2011_GWF2_33_10]OGJ44235.1 MAG: hypothetical protein A2263_04645 [Candidatus Peregrinibacteria bacterium RIFOXYA2_FULL_33_21]OGJ47198.1 MAG: hypothetical protein A2272_06335 [Candidatus Peregrinibacteria bacterium RIFOXYA12_FULL_33_12]OGJ49946.1 MAG: hypothetical protein A2307_00820 [Candidatus Peregrinibacteria bacterium RIFOXYB2_FULL_33_20]